MKRRKIVACAASDRKYRQFYQDCRECAELDAMNAAVNKRLEQQEMRAMEREMKAEERRQKHLKKVDAMMNAMSASAIFLIATVVLAILADAGFISWLLMAIVAGALGIVCAFIAGRYWCEIKQ